MELHFEVASWTLARLCGSGCVTSDAGGFEPASNCALTGFGRVGLAAGPGGLEWHQEAFGDRTWRDDGDAADAAGRSIRAVTAEIAERIAAEQCQPFVGLLGECCERLRIVFVDIEKFAIG